MDFNSKIILGRTGLKVGRIGDFIYGKKRTEGLPKEKG